MAELVPPVAFDDLVLVNVVDCPEVALALVEEDCLVDWLERDCWRSWRLVELVLVVAAVEGHFYEARVMLVGVGVIHGVELTRR